jgi:hypothetical protein
MRYVAFHELSDKDMENYYKQRIFPKLKSLGVFRVIIRDCWNGKYNYIDSVIKEIDR